jgi:hypothetical protein
MPNWVESSTKPTARYVYWVENRSGYVVMQPTFSESLAKNYADYHNNLGDKPIHFAVKRSKMTHIEEMIA